MTSGRAEEYNYDHYHRSHLAVEIRSWLSRRGVAPGLPAPDFALSAVGGGVVTLGDLRDRPTLVHFGSYT